MQVCHKRNVHERTLDDIQKAVAALEQPQPSFPQVVPATSPACAGHTTTTSTGQWPTASADPGHMPGMAASDSADNLICVPAAGPVRRLWPVAHS